MRIWLRLGLLTALTLSLSACGGLKPMASFEHIDDRNTTEPRHLAEGGHSPEIIVPNGQTWRVRLQGWEKPLLHDLPSRSYQLEITIVDEKVEPDKWRSSIAPQTAMLVDDQGRKYVCSRALLPQEPAPPPEQEGDPAVRHYTLIFALPSAYRFRLIGKLTVHWQIKIDGQTLKVTSRFQQ